LAKTIKDSQAPAAESKADAAAAADAADAIQLRGLQLAHDAERQYAASDARWWHDTLRPGGAEPSGRSFGTGRRGEATADGAAGC